MDKFFSPIIGLEIHIELKTASKMFCGCSANHFGKKPNTQVCPICLGLPGALPAPNKKAIDWTVLAGLALGCQIPKFSKFDRKNYFYPDLPKGYQISQYDLPLGINGKLELKVSNQSRNEKNIKSKIIRIRRVHLEEDTAKMIHYQNFTLLDFNRAGVPLIEIVTEPDFESSDEVKEFLVKLQQIVRWIGIAEANMEKGQMRCEPTVNLKIKKGKKIFYTPLVELKNINSFRFVKKAIEYEVKRQLEEFEKTGEVKREGNKTTRGWDEKKGITVLQREKEEAADYRYFPEPDIPPIRWRKIQITNFKLQILELPEVKREKFIKEYGLTDYQAKILTSKKEMADYFEKVVKLGRGKLEISYLANFIINKKVEISRISPNQLIRNLLEKEKITKITGGELEKIILEALKENQKATEDYKKGKVNAVQFLIGQVMAKTKGQAKPEEIKEKLVELIS